MEDRGRVSQGIITLAQNRIERYLQQKVDQGERVVSLSELSEDTAIDPTTAEAVMNEFVQRENHPCQPVTSSDTRWYLRRDI